MPLSCCKTNQDAVLAILWVQLTAPQVCKAWVTGSTFRLGIAVVAAMLKDVGDLVVNRHKALQMTGRFESAHDILSHTNRVMRIHCPVVQSLVLVVLEFQTQFILGCRVALEFARDHYPNKSNALSV